jgi:hypothetical protein
LFEEEPAGDASAGAEAIVSSIGIAQKAVAAEPGGRAGDDVIASSLRRAPDPRGRSPGFLYAGGHFRAYHGQRAIPKACLARTRLAVPGTADYRVNDQQGEPLFAVIAEANAALTRMLKPVLAEVRALTGPRRRVAIVFGRGGWSPRLFQERLGMDFDILSYRKGRVRRIAEKRFLRRTASLEPADQEPRVTLSPLSAPHRSLALAPPCEDLNRAEACFAGTELRMRFKVAGDAG